MHARAAFAVASTVLGLVATACTSSTPHPAATSAARTRLRIVESGPRDIKSVPFLMAVDALRTEGYDIEFVTVQSFDLVPAVLTRGDAEMGRVSTQAAWTAIAKGAALRSVVEANGSWEVVARQDIRHCRDLHGQGTAFSSARSVNMAMLQRFIADRCPGTEPQLVLISHSNSRVAALLAGRIAAAQLELQDVLQLDRQAPGRFHTLLQTSTEFPQVAVFTYAVRQDWAQQHPAVVKAFIRAFLTAQRHVIDNPRRVDEAATRFSVDVVDAGTLADIYRTRKLWDANGGLTAEKIRSSLDFLAAERAVPEGLHPTQVADLSYLSAVLDEIGRR